MQRLARRWTFLTIIVLLALVVAFHSLPQLWKKSGRSPIDQLLRPGIFRTKFIWKNLHQQHPVWNLSKLPTGPVANVPKVQADFQFESDRDKSERKRRLAAVEEAFLHSWEGYKSHAWLHDEVGPLSGQSSNEFGGWGATLVDSLDTLWIMDMKREFAFAVSDLKKIDFTTTDLDTLNVFETTIRYLGGLLSAYDISGHKYKILLQKAIELGDMLYMAFDTPNRMPVTRWDWKNAAIGEQQEADTHALLAEVGSMTLEFTRLSQITGDNKWYDAITRVTDATHERQNDTKIPGLWPTLINMRILDFKRGTTFTFGGMADSLYEYLPKQYLMLGGNNNQYHDMYLAALESAKEHLFFIPLNRQNENMLLTGTLERKAAGDLDFIPQAQHLSCFAGGMVALAAKVFDATNEFDTARQLVDGCLWAYESMPSGIMPEIFTAVPCDKQIHQDCRWSEDHWHNAVSRTCTSVTPTISVQMNQHREPSCKTTYHLA